ncbi:MAG: hypothetical protein JWP06_230 [Candidatus Saccharibacteria bacterium]|nr:hypothetical protein [Candidatus Saccharibacteria bacterium]
MKLSFEFQPDFPKRDITDSTAAMLEELFLADPARLEAEHLQAEQFSLLYRLGHQVLGSAARTQLDSEHVAALSTGMGIYEALSPNVRLQTTDGLDNPTVMRHIMRMKEVLLSDEHLAKIIIAKDQLTDELPRTTYIIGQGAVRFWPSLRDYVVGGAAIARQVELNAMNDLSSFDDEFPNIDD